MQENNEQRLDFEVNTTTISATVSPNPDSPLASLLMDVHQHKNQHSR